jgi:type III secretion protein J
MKSSIIRNAGFWLRHGLCLFALLALTACSQQVSLFNDLSESDANDVYSELIRSGFAAKKVPADKGFRIEVPSSMVGEALSLLASKGLPKDRKNSIGEIFNNDSMISSPLQERARYLYALSQELERTLMTMDGVVESRVHIVLPERTSGTQELTPSSVAVFVKHEPDSPFPAYLGRIRELVLSSIPTMSMDKSKDNVSIVAIPSARAVTEPLSLVWFGPLAIKVADRFYFLGVVYLLIAAWLISLAAVYLVVVEPARRPAFLQGLLKLAESDDKKAKDKEAEQGA